MEPQDKELIGEKFKGVYARIDASHEILLLEIKKSQEVFAASLQNLTSIQNQTLEQTKKTNGRVTKIETVTIPELQKETSIWRYIQNNPKKILSSLLVPIGFLFPELIKQIAELTKQIKSLF